MKKLFLKIAKIVMALFLLVFIVTLAFYQIRKENITKIENEINKMISGEIFTEVQYENYTEQLKLYSQKPISKSALGTVYNRLSYQCEQDGDWLGYYKNFGKAVYYLEESENYNDEINLYCDLVYYVCFAGGNFDSASKIMQKVDKLTAKCKNLNNQTDALVSQRHAMLAYYLGDYEKAVIEAEKSKKTVENFNAVYSKPFYDAAQIIIAKINIEKGDYKLAEELIEANKDSPVLNDDYTFSMVITNFVIPYYQLLSYVSARNKDEEKLRFCIEQISEKACNYDFEYAVSDTLSILRKNYSFSPEFYSWLDRQELQIYKKFIFRKTKTYSYVCNGLIESSYEEIKEDEFQHASYMHMGHLFFALIASIILLAVLSIILHNRLDTDVLTGVGNRRAFDKIVKKNARKKLDYSVMMIDIDDFKKVNDTFGHAEGDKVLQKIGSILENIENKKIVPYRYGGEEFSILLYDTFISKRKEIAENLRLQIECQEWGKAKPITISVGVADTIGEADKNLYTAKNNGKNQVVI